MTTLKTLEWPKDKDELSNYRNLTFKIINIDKTKTNIDIEGISFENKNTKMRINDEILIGCTCKILELHSNGIMLGDITNDKNIIISKKFIFKNYHGKIVFQWQKINNKKNSNNKSGSLQNTHNKTEKKLVNEEVIPKNSLENKLKVLENKLKELELQFENHYHDIPTTGIRQFTKQHPFYKNP
jgi:hypothetical protein